MGQKPSDAELQSLISQLTIDEKISMLAGKNTWETTDVPRLSIPSLKLSDGPNGARGGEFYDGTTAACFPSCVSLAATFNRDLSRRVGIALGQEAQTKGAYALLGPTVCIHRSPLGGRNFEAFSEDPFLSGILAAEYIKGLQSERVAATVKHFVANEQDTRRFSVNEKISDRALREIYLRAFEIAIKESDPWCIMTSYPKVNGYHIDAQSKFLTDILRKEWNYSGLVMSDWGATTDASKSIKHGLDLEMPGPPTHRTLEAVQESLKDGETNPQDIDARVLALLKLLRQTGKLTDRKNTPQEQAISRPEHEALIRAAGAEGIVLLKNERSILPLEPKKGQKIAILGPLAKYASAHGGGSASLNCHYKMSPYEAFHSRLKECELSYSKGTHIFRVLPDLEAGCVSKRGNPGFVAELYKSFDLSGDCFYSEEYPRGSFMTLMNEKAKGAQSARFSTKFTPPTSGKHYLGFSGLGPSKLFINGELVSHQVRETRDSMSFLLGVQEEKRLQYPFESGKPYHMVIESIPSQVNNSELYLLDGQISVHLGFVEQEEMQRDILGEAIDIAKAADLAICCVGNTMQWETEGQDMESMTLPADGSQDRLIAEVAKANPNTIVVIATGVPVEMPWLKEAPAVLQAWYGGQETGNAILDVILGEVNPSGKLPISWPRKYEDTACHGHFGLDSYESREVKYVEGVKIGYRHFDSMYGTEREVLYPFGYGLSYSSFEIFSASISGNLSAEDAGAEVLVSVTVKNTSSTDGAETVQVYLSPPDGSRDHDRPPQSLVAFGKVFLKSGDLETLDLHFKRDGAAFWSEQTQRWVIESGIHEVKVSTSSSPDDVKKILSLPVSGFSFQP